MRTYRGQRFLYKKLATEIEKKIHSGAYRAGDRLPSIRHLQKKLNLSLSTVYQAYIELETLGLVEARPKSGYFVKPVGLHQLPAPSYSKRPVKPRKVELTSIVNSVIAAAQNPELTHFGSSALSPDILPFKSFHRILKNITGRDMKGLLTYSLAEGDFHLRQQMARRLLGLVEGIGPEDIIITHGCTEAIALSLQAVASPGDVVAIESPTHFGFLQLLDALGYLAVEVPTNPQTGVDLDAFEKMLLRQPIKACIFMPNFHNPSGALMPDENKERLAGLLGHHRIPVIEDDIYGELYYGKQRPSLLGSFDSEGLVITCSSFSKVVAPGFRVGWTIPGDRYKEKIQKLRAGVSISVSTLDQYLLTQLLAESGYERYLRILRNNIKRQVYQTASAIQTYFPDGIKLALPKGGNLLWVELPRQVDSLEVYNRALDNNISIVPGWACSLAKQYRNYIRMGCGSPFTPETEKAIKTLGTIISQVSG